MAQRITQAEISNMSKAERERLMSLAFGRLLAIGSRPSRPGDVDEYENIKHLMLALDAA